MRIEILLMILFCYLQISINAQNKTIILHQAVGEVITNDEKVKYLLFQEIADSIYDYSTIIQKDSSFILYTHLVNKTYQQRELDTVELNTYYTNINKLEAYFKYQDEKKNNDSLNLDLKTNISARYSILSPMITDETKDKIYKETFSKPTISDKIQREALKNKGFLTGDEMTKFYYPNGNKKRK